MNIKRTDSSDADFIFLTEMLDNFLSDYNGEKNDFYSPLNKIKFLNNCVVGYIKDIPVSCGALKKYNAESVEIKRMFTLPEFRNQNCAKIILTELESWASELGFKYCILETGIGLTNAINLYKKSSYHQTENYEPYIGKTESICFAKKIEKP